MVQTAMTEVRGRMPVTKAWSVTSPSPQEKASAQSDSQREVSGVNTIFPLYGCTRFCASNRRNLPCCTVMKYTDNSMGKNLTLVLIIFRHYHLLSMNSGCFTAVPRSGELRTQKLKSPLMRTRTLKVVPLKPGVGQYIAMHGTLTARDFTVHSPAFFPKPLPSFSCVGCG